MLCNSATPIKETVSILISVNRRSSAAKGIFDFDLGIGDHPPASAVRPGGFHLPDYQITQLPNLNGGTPPHLFQSSQGLKDLAQNIASDALQFSRTHKRDSFHPNQR